ncbi:MAG: hypothetical protein IJT66_03405 [Clostridia bacterium]|nr:hypothetical protein [Clostridia bacterium]
MITLAPLQDQEKIKALFAENHLAFGENAGCVAACAGEETLGYSLYDLRQDGMTIYQIVPDEDLMLADGILRSTLHVAVQRGLTDAYYKGESIERLAKKLDFILNPDEHSLNIQKLFQSCHGC